MNEAEAKLGCCAVIVLALMCSSCAGVKCMGGLNVPFSEGSRSGVVQKISKKGLIWSTWEGELNLGYTTATKDANGGTTINPAIFRFSCSSDSAAKQVQAAERSGKRVTLKYQQYIFRGYKYGDTSYDVTGVATDDPVGGE